MRRTTLAVLLMSLLGLAPGAQAHFSLGGLGHIGLPHIGAIHFGDFLQGLALGGLFAGAATAQPKTVPLDAAGAASLKDQTISCLDTGSGKFASHDSLWKRMVAPHAKYQDGAEIAHGYSLEDPSLSVGADLLLDLNGRYAVRPVGQTLDSPRACAAGGKGRFTLKLDTTGWNLLGPMFDDSVTGLHYAAELHLTDQDGKLLAYGRCDVSADLGGSSRSLQQVLADQAALLQKLSEDAAAKCAASLETGYLIPASASH